MVTKAYTTSLRLKHGRWSMDYALAYLLGSAAVVGRESALKVPAFDIKAMVTSLDMSSCTRSSRLECEERGFGSHEACRWPVKRLVLPS